MEGAIAIFLFLAASLPSCDGQSSCNYNKITNCTNKLTVDVFSNLNDNTMVCRSYYQYQQCVYSEPGCDASTIIADLKSQMLRSNVNFQERCEGGATTRTPPMIPTTPWPMGSTPRGTWRPTSWAPPMATRYNMECDVNAIRMCSNNLQREYAAGKRCDAARDFVACLNRLVSCMQNPAFTQARMELEGLGLREMCGDVMPPVTAAAASLVSVMTSLPFALMVYLWI
ncbi:uncharacterized protein LOC124137159 isoform X1 [Haliotis rufescens]|uniref:uncharacterized protein LOC124137159 isoform X1 n=1 Tax=Haliotis rufescens TaxID=6454 RepID=UPI00201EBA3F|nr:uncharacterized protein LOC124137159 isoform X1 [Haliotis rufescens]